MTTCLIIGGGLAGASLALALSHRGCGSIIIESTAIGSAASGNPAGLAVLDSGRLERPPFRDIAGFSALLATVESHRAAGREIDAVLGPCIQFPVTDRLRNRVEQEGRSCDILSHIAGVSIRESALLQEGLCLNPRALCQAHVTASKTEVILASVYRLERARGLWRALSRSGELLAAAPNVCVANAADAASLRHSSWLKVERVRGQVILLHHQLPELPLIPVCFDGYVLPLARGGHLIGADYDHGSLERRVHPGVSRKLWERMSRWIDVPPIPSSALSGRVAFRTTTHDRYPYIGALHDYDTFRLQANEVLSARRPVSASEELIKNCPMLPGFFVSVGHGSRGLISAHYAAEVIADQIAGPLSGKPALALDPALSPIRLLARLLRDLRGLPKRGSHSCRNERDD